MNIEQEINALQEQIDKLREQQNDNPWEPSGGDYWIESRGVVGLGGSHHSTRLNGNEFKTREEAERAAEYYRFYHQLYKLAQECNAIFKESEIAVVNFRNNDNKWNYYLIEYASAIDTIFTSAESAQRACEIMNRDQWKLPC